jgi:hypothetical protein
MDMQPKSTSFLALTGLEGLLRLNNSSHADSPNSRNCLQLLYGFLPSLYFSLLCCRYHCLHRRPCLGFGFGSNSISTSSSWASRYFRIRRAIPSPIPGTVLIIMSLCQLNSYLRGQTSFKFGAVVEFIGNVRSSIALIAVSKARNLYLLALALDSSSLRPAIVLYFKNGTRRINYAHFPVMIESVLHLDPVHRE